MKIKKDGYAAILQALATCYQMEAHKLILLGYADCLSLSICIDFLGKTEPLSEYFNDVEIQQIIECAREKLLEDQYTSNYPKLNISTVRISLLRNTELPSTSLYLPRKLFKRVVINTKLFQKNYPDIFVFKGVQTLTKLSKLIHPQLASSSGFQLRREKLSCSFIFLEHNEDWEKISNIAQVPCHLVRYEVDTKSCILEKTSGGSKILCQHLEKSTIGEGAHMAISEDKFIEDILADTAPSSGVCICDSPGMGKTFLLSKLAIKLGEKCADRLVAFISLPDFIKHLTKHGIPFNVDIAYTQNALLEYLSTSPLSLCILDRIITKDKISMELLFDGFDEVDFKSVDFTIQLLKQLSSHYPRTRVFVTSRSHMRHELEASLGVIAYDILPFTEANQIDFLVNSWTSNEKDDSKLKEFAGHCLKNLGGILTKDEQRITGIPLLCQIIAKVYSRKAKTFCRSPVNTLRDVESSLQFETSLPKLYKEYIQGSFEKLGNISESIVDAKKYHVWMAFKTLFPEFESEYFQEFSVNSSKPILKSSISLGLLESRWIGSKETVQFVHRTFAEYFLAEFFGETLNNVGQQRSQNFDNQAAKFLLKMVLVTKETGSPDDIEGNVFIYPGIVYFLNYFTENLKTPSEGFSFAQHFKDSVSPAHFYGMLIGCLRENHANVFNVIERIFAQLDTAAKGRFKTELIPDGETHLITGLLNVASVFSSISLVTALFAFFKDNLMFELESVCKKLPLHLDTPLHFAIENANVEKIQYFARIIPLHNRNLLMSCVVNSNEDSQKIVERKAAMCRLLLSMDKDNELLSEAAYTLYDSVHVEILKVLIEQGSNTAEFKSEENLVHRAAKYMSDTDFHELCRFLIEDVKAYHLFSRSEQKWQNPLPCILQHQTKSVKLLETIQKILNVPCIKVNEKYDNGNTLFLSAVYGRHGEEMISLLTNAGADINAVNLRRQNALHLAAEASNICVIPLLIKLGVDHGHLDVLQNSFLHCLGTEGSATEDFHEIISLLASTGLTDVFHVRNKKRQLPIHIAVRQLELNLETLKIFKTCNVDFNSVDEDNSSLLMYAVAGTRSVQFLTALITKFDADVMAKNLEGETFAHIISKYYSAEQYHELVNAIISTGQTQAFTVKDNMGQTPLHWSVRYLELLPETLKLMQDNMVNFNVTDKHNLNLLFFAASGRRSVPFIKSLLDIGVDGAIQNTEGDTFAHRIQDVYSPKEYHEIMELLFERGYERVYQVENRYGQTPLYLAVTQMKPHEDTLHVIREKLVKTGIVNINRKDQNGHTILHAAVVGNDPLFTIRKETPLPIVKWDKEEKNFLTYRSIEGGSKSKLPQGKWDAHHLKILIGMGADITIQDKGGYTFAHYIPFYHSAEQYHDIMEMLFREGHAQVFRIVNMNGFTPLHNAIYNLELLDKTLRLIHHSVFQTKIVDINCTDTNGNSFLMYAANAKRSAAFLENLMKMRIDVTIQNNVGNTFAHQIAAYYSPQDYNNLVKLIIETRQGNVFQVVNQRGQNPLHIAVYHLEPLEVTLDLINDTLFQTNIVDVNVRDNDGNSLLVCAADGKRSAKFMEKLLEMGADPAIADIDGNNLAHVLPECYTPQEYHSMVELLIGKKYGRIFHVLNENEETALQVAIVKLELLETTLDLVNTALFQTNIVNINYTDTGGNSLLGYAVKGKRNVNLLEKILKMGVDPMIQNNDGNTFAHFIQEFYAPHEFHKIMEMIIRTGNQKVFQVTNADKQTALHAAILNMEVLEATLDLVNVALFRTKTVNINCQDKDGNSLLANAVMGKRSVRFLENLIKLGIDFAIQNVYGNTFAHFIQDYYKTPQEYHSIVELIVRDGAQTVFQLVNENGQTPLHVAIHKLELLEASLDLFNKSLFQTNIVNINLKDNQGNSILTHAVFGERSVGFLERLLKMGADVMVQNEDGNTFMHLLSQQEHYTPEDYHTVVELLVRLNKLNVFHVENVKGQTALHVAILKLELLEKTLKIVDSKLFQTNIANRNCVDTEGNSFLVYACTGKRKVNFIENLIKMGTDLTIQNEDGNTFAHFLQDFYSAQDYHHIVEMLIERGQAASILQIVNDNGETPLQAAIQELELLESTLELLNSQLLKTGVLDVNCIDSEGNSFLAHAVIGERSCSFLQVLMKIGVNPAIQDKDGNNFAHLSPDYYTAQDYHKIVELITKSGHGKILQAVNKNGETPLHSAVQKLELLEETLNLIVEALLQTKMVDINVKDKDGNCLLVYALKGNRSVEQLENLMEIGVDPAIQNTDGDTFAHLIPHYNYSPHQYHKIVTLLMSTGHAKIFQVENNHGQSPLHVAVYHVELLGETLDLLAACYMSVNNEIPGNMLHPGRLRGVNAVDKTGESVLHWALRGKRSLQLVQHLVNLGADIFVKNNRNSTLAHICASFGLIEHLKYFVGLGCDVNALDNDGDTVLQCAVCDATENVFEMVSFLVVKGAAEIRHRNNKDQTAYEQAVQRDITDARVFSALK